MTVTRNIITFVATRVAIFSTRPAMALQYRHTSLTQSLSSSCSLPQACSVGYWLEGSRPGRLLPDAFLQDELRMSVEVCYNFCAIENNYSLFGVEYGTQCFCANDIQAGSGFPINKELCNYPCVGMSNETCGGDGAISIYQALPPPPPLPPGLINNYTYTASGCYAEPADGSRALGAFVNANPWQGSLTCANICGLSNYQYFGLEDGDECWCGNRVSPLAIPVDYSKCTAPCTGNQYNGANETCGGALYLNLYTGTPINRTQHTETTRLDYWESSMSLKSHA